MDVKKELEKIRKASLGGLLVSNIADIGPFDIGHIFNQKAFVEEKLEELSKILEGTDTNKKDGGQGKNGNKSKKKTKE